MSVASPIWREGLLLTPQHLQQAARATESAMAAMLRAAMPLGHGVVRLRHDPAALAAGCFRLVELDVVMPDGTPVRADQPDDLPPGLELAARWPEGAQRATVHLVIALPVPGGVDVAADGVHEGRRTRWRTRIVEIADATGGRPRHVEVQLPHLRLLLDGEDRDGQASLPVAELARPATDRFEPDAAIAPPCLRIDAAPALLGCCRRLEELISARTSELAAHRRSRARGLVEFAVGDIGSVLALQALGRQLAVLRGRLAAGWAHPAMVHEGLVALLGELTALAGDGDPGTAPAYDHRHPHLAFAALEEALRPLLRSVIHTRYVPIALRAVSERLHAGSIPEQATAGADYFLAVISNLPTERVLRDVPLRARIASQGRIDALVAAAMPGIRVTYVAVPPAEVPVQQGGAYFRLETRGEEWDLAFRTRSLAVFLPPELANARVEFLAIAEAG